MLAQEIFYLGVDTYVYKFLHRQDRQTQTNLPLGAPEFLEILSYVYEPFKRVCIFNLHKLWCIYKARWAPASEIFTEFSVYFLC